MRTRKGARHGVGCRERMKRVSGIKDRDERSRGVEILMTDVFTKIKPTEPFRLAKQVMRRNRNESDSFDSSLVKAGTSP